MAVGTAAEVAPSRPIKIRATHDAKCVELPGCASERASLGIHRPDQKDKLIHYAIGNSPPAL